MLKMGTALPFHHHHNLFLNSTTPHKRSPKPNTATFTHTHNPTPSSSHLTRALVEIVASGSMQHALTLFDKMYHCHSDTFLWNVMIRGYTDHGLFLDAINLYQRMRYQGVRTDNFTYPFVIKACGVLLAFTEGEKIHANLIKVGLDADVYICNALIVMYGKLGHIGSALKVFEEMPVRDLVSWNSIISAYSSVQQHLSSLKWFRELLRVGIQPHKFSLIIALESCSLCVYLLGGKEIHCFALKLGLELDIMVQTSVVDMYCKCGMLSYAERVFDRISLRNSVAWNAMIGGYSLNNHFRLLVP